MRNALKIGDRVTTIGGIRGKVVKVGEEYLTLEVSNMKTKLEVTKWAVGSVDNSDAAVHNTKETVVEEEIVEEVESDSTTEDRGL